MGFLSKLRARVSTPSPAARPPMGGSPFPSQPVNLIQVPDLSRKLVTRYGIREKAPAPTLSTEVIPVVLVDDLIGESDLIRPRIRPCAGQLEFNAAGGTPILGLVNPNGSRIIVHLYYFVLSASALGAIDLHFTGTPTTTTSGTSAFRNGLLPGATPAGLMQGIISAVSPGGAIFNKVRIVANQNFVLPCDAVIDEGQGIQFRTPTAYTGLISVNAYWTEEDK